MNTSSQSAGNFFPSRIDKTLEWFEESRDSWKEKAKVAKDDLKKKKLALKRARSGRNLLQEELSKEKTIHYRVREELSQKDAEIAELKAQLEKRTQEVEEFKKKRLLH
jgi:septal ring factor EnvC (AmiA/AmiB activator)